MIITSTKLIALLKPKITKVGKVAMRDLDFAVKMVNEISFRCKTTHGMEHFDTKILQKSS